MKQPTFSPQKRKRKNGGKIRTSSIFKSVISMDQLNGETGEIGCIDNEEELISKYKTLYDTEFMDTKDKREKDHQEYLQNTPEVGMILNDLLESLLTVKPPNVFEYFLKYFSVYIFPDSGDVDADNEKQQ